MTILIGVYSELAFWNLPADYVARLRERFPAHTFLHATSPADTMAMIPDADVVFMSELRPPQFAAARRLRWIHSPAAGVGGMLSPELVASPVVLTNSRGLGADTIAEHALAVTLALFRRLPLMFARQQARQWAQAEAFGPPAPRTLAGSRVLVIGMGSIGRAAAERFEALGATVTGIRRSGRRAGEPAAIRIERPARLLDLLGEADVVLIAAPQTPETRGLIGADALAIMRRDAILVNVSRGKIVDQAALVAALDAGRLAGAALDVFEREPLDPASPLWGMPNVLITPHMAGFREQHWAEVTDLFADNLRRFLDGRELLNVVDKLAGY